MDSPNTENYTLGKGIIYFNKKSLTTGLFEGERDLGNAPAVSLNVSLEELAHFSSRGGLKAKDKKIISQVSPVINFTLDEDSADNVAMLYMAEKAAVTQAAADNLMTTITPLKNRYFDLGYRSAGIISIAYNTLTSAFTEGALLTGGTSGATATILQVIETDATTGALLLWDVTGNFEAAETITDDNGTPGSATATAPEAFISTNVSIAKSGGGFHAQGTDYTVDSKSGRLFITADSTIPDGTDIDIYFAADAATYTRIKALAETQVIGQLRFVSDNPAGPQKEIKIWNTSITPTGDTAYIGDDWSTMSFVGEILKDETGHPDSPYADIIMD